MPRVCTVCAHTDRPAIDQALVNRRPFRNIAQQVGVSVWALLRHHDDHLPATLAQAKAADDVARADDLLVQVQDLQATALRLLARAEQTGDLRTALAGIGQARGCLELLAKLRGQLDERPVVNLLLAPEWTVVKVTLLAALRPYPEARVAVADCLASVEASAEAAG